MVALLLGPAGKADSNGRAKNALTPMHLAAQEDHVHVAEVLIQHQGQVEPQTKVLKMRLEGYFICERWLDNNI